MPKICYLFALLLALSACRDQEPITYPKTFEVQNVRVDDFRFYRKATDTRFDSISSVRRVQMMFDQHKDFGRKEMEANLRALEQVVLESETDAKFVYVDPDNPTLPKEVFAFKYKIENDLLKIEGDSASLKDLGSLFHYNKDAQTLSYFGRLSALSYYDQEFQQRLPYARWDVAITDHSNYAKHVREVAALPYVKSTLKVGDTMVIAATKVTYLIK